MSLHQAAQLGKCKAIFKEANHNITSNYDSAATNPAPWTPSLCIYEKNFDSKYIRW